MTIPPVVPAPASIRASDDAPFVLEPGIVITGDADATDFLRALIRARTGLAATTQTDAPTAPTAPTITLAIATSGRRESYRIDASAAAVTATGADAAGLFYAVQTLGQLVAPGDGAWAIPAVRIEDAPRFGYRGVMLDTARHFHTVATVKAYIDRASSLKFNALHLHLTDDQGWRLQLASRPLLTEKASSTGVGGDPGGFYSQEDYCEIIDYAASRHMIVVPEVDLPGHTHAVSLAYPELCEEPVLSAHILDTVRDFGGEVPVNGRPYDGMAVGFSSLKIRDEATYAFLTDVLGEIARLTPGPYLHIGGDEALGTPTADYDAFVARVSRMVASLGKVPFAWHEAGAADLDPRTVGQYWGYVTPTDGMDDKARGFAARGSTLVMSPADAVYLDMKFDADSPLGLTWANGITNAQRAYEWDPASVIEGVGEGDILGVEAPLWAETIRTLADIDALAFPRIAAPAEIAWSPRPDASELRTWDSFTRRVAAQGPLWTSLGIEFTPLPEFPWVGTPTDATTGGDS